MMPIFLNKKPIGLIYTDCGITDRPLTEEDFVAFKHFAQHANIGIPYILGKN